MIDVGERITDIRGQIFRLEYPEIRDSVLALAQFATVAHS
jgi:hypothetical protein